MIRRIGDGQICYGMVVVVVAAPKAPKAAPLLPSLRCHVTREPPVGAGHPRPLSKAVFTVTDRGSKWLLFRLPHTSPTLIQYKVVK